MEEVGSLKLCGEKYVEKVQFGPAQNEPKPRGAALLAGQADGLGSATRQGPVGGSLIRTGEPEGRN